MTLSSALLRVDYLFSSRESAEMEASADITCFNPDQNSTRFPLSTPAPATLEESCEDDVPQSDVSRKRMLSPEQSPNLEIGTLSKQSKSISNIKQSSRFVSKVMKRTYEAHKSSRSCYQSFRKIDKFYQNLLGSNLVNETYQIPLIGGGQKGKETNIYELSSPGPKP